MPANAGFRLDSAWPVVGQAKKVSVQKTKLKFKASGMINAHRYRDAESSIRLRYCVVPM